VKEERGLRFSRIRCWVRIGPKRDEVTGEWRRLQNKKLYDMYSSPNIIRGSKPRRMRWTGHVARMGKRSACRLLVGRPKGRRSLGRPRHRWEDDIKINLLEGDGKAWIGLIWLRIEKSGELLCMR
jgi:hypothetical protein